MALFNGMHYVLSSSIQAKRYEELSALLDLHGATRAPPHTHLIALAGLHTQDEHQGSLHVVSDMWVQRSVVLGKLQPERYYSPDPIMIFSGVVACATDLSRCDLEVLSAGITSLGGQWRTALTRDVTHLFALHKRSDKGSRVREYHCIDPQDPVPTGGANDGFDDGIPNVWISTGVQVSKDIHEGKLKFHYHGRTHTYEATHSGNFVFPVKYLDGINTDYYMLLQKNLVTYIKRDLTTIKQSHAMVFNRVTDLSKDSALPTDGHLNSTYSF
ncbi:hypothetical protein F4604DRAFT_1931431 [Suillus subluteus]|nr:hypothetical protein F4604DRAFT_1931431 [Suillus subluteus]